MLDIADAVEPACVVAAAAAVGSSFVDGGVVVVVLGPLHIKVVVVIDNWIKKSCWRRRRHS